MNDENIWCWEGKRQNAHLKDCLFFNPFQNWTINSICNFLFKASLHHCSFLSWHIRPHTIYEARGSQMIWKVKKWWLIGFEKFPNDWYSNFSIMILFVLYVIYLSLAFFILCQHAYFKDNTISRKCLMHWGINILYILKLPFQFLIQPQLEKFQSSKKCVTLGWYNFCHLRYLFFFFFPFS